jgi:hypothetical protein
LLDDLYQIVVILVILGFKIGKQIRILDSSNKEKHCQEIGLQKSISHIHIGRLHIGEQFGMV